MSSNKDQLKSFFAIKSTKKWKHFSFFVDTTKYLVKNLFEHFVLGGECSQINDNAKSMLFESESQNVVFVCNWNI